MFGGWQRAGGKKPNEESSEGSDDPLTPFKKMESGGDQKRVSSSGVTSDVYRGFSTSISHSFVHIDEEQGDMCALACCGLMQKDKNAFIMTGKRPGTLFERASIAFIFCSIVIAALVLFFLKTNDNNNNDNNNNTNYYYIGGSMLGLLVLYGLYLTCQASKKRSELRREILWNKFREDGAVAPRPEECDCDDDTHVIDYMQGQKSWDVWCAHAPVCGCYKTDITASNSNNIQARNDCCAVLYKCFTCSWCCHYMFGCFLQFCGICAVAQETREIHKMVPPHRLAVDYITLQPVLEYYSEILRLRRKRDGNIFKHNRAVSLLSQQLTILFLLALGVFLICGFIFSRRQQFWIVTMGIATTVALTWIVHWPFHKLKISTDAVIKSFASGFCLASTAAFLLEGSIGVICESVVFLFSFLIDEGYITVASSSDITIMDDAMENITSFDDDFYNETMMADDDAYLNMTDDAYLNMTDDAYLNMTDDAYFNNNTADYAAASYVHLGNVFNEDFWVDYPIAYMCFLFFQCFFIAAFIEELMKYMAFRMISNHPDFWSKSHLEQVIEGTKNEKIPMVDLDNLPDMSSKYQAPSIHQRCHATMVATVSVSLGFACCENVVQALFYFNDGAVGWNFLLIRTLMLLIHPICAVWQAIGICRRDVELDSQYQSGRILLPAVFWHGLFDFLVLAINYLVENEYYNLTESDVIKIPLVVLAVALLVVVFQFASQQSRVHRLENPGKFDDSRPWAWDMDKHQSSGSVASNVMTSWTFDLSTKASFLKEKEAKAARGTKMTEGDVGAEQMDGSKRGGERYSPPNASKTGATPGVIVATVSNVSSFTDCTANQHINRSTSKPADDAGSAADASTKSGCASLVYGNFMQNMGFGAREQQHTTTAKIQGTARAVANGTSIVAGDVDAPLDDSGRTPKAGIGHGFPDEGDDAAMKEARGFENVRNKPSMSSEVFDGVESGSGASDKKAEAPEPDKSLGLVNQVNTTKSRLANLLGTLDRGFDDLKQIPSATKTDLW